MGGNNKQKRGRTYVRLAILALGILLLAFVDVIVLERIYKPISTEHAIPWEEFQIHVPLAGENARMLWWHVAFVPLGIVIFALVGTSGRDLGLAMAGIVLFATGWEDIAYYAIQFKLVPQQLTWLDVNPAIAWARILTRNAHVTRVELIIAAVAGGVLAVIILGFQWIWRHRRRSETFGGGEQQYE
jgi:hypothetical protein